MEVAIVLTSDCELLTEIISDNHFESNEPLLRQPIYLSAAHPQWRVLIENGITGVLHFEGL